VSKQNLNTEFIPYSLLKEAREVLGEEFSRLTHRYQVGYVDIFWNNYGLTRNNRHSKQSDSFKMPRANVNRFFVDQRNFRALNDTGYYLGYKRTRHGLGDKVSFSRSKAEGYARYEPTEWVEKTFTAHGNNTGGGRCNGFKLAPEIAKTMDGWFIKQLAEDDEEPQGMVNIHGDKVEDVAKEYGGGIVREVSKVSKNVNVEVLVKINRTSLMHHKVQLELVKDYLVEHSLETLIKGSKEWLKVRDKLEGLSSGKRVPEPDSGLVGVKVNNTKDKPLESLSMKDFTKDGVQQRIIQINRLLVISKHIGNSKVNVNYYEVSTGRYHTKGAILQGYNKSVRYAALSGCYEYDLEAAHQNILVQLLDKEGASFEELDVVREYISNKVETRKRLAKELNTSVAIVKTIIQELTYGARLSRYRGVAIYDTCNGDKQLIERVITHPWLKAYSSTFTIANKILVGRKRKITNAVGIKVDVGNKRSALAHILQGCERQVLDSLIAHCNTKDIAILLHDCVVFYKEQSLEKLSQIVRAETGFNLKFSEEKY